MIQYKMHPLSVWSLISELWLKESVLCFQIPFSSKVCQIPTIFKPSISSCGLMYLFLALQTALKHATSQSAQQIQITYKRGSQFKKKMNACTPNIMTIYWYPTTHLGLVATDMIDMIQNYLIRSDSIIHWFIISDLY